MNKFSGFEETFSRQRHKNNLTCERVVDVRVRDASGLGHEREQQELERFGLRQWKNTHQSFDRFASRRLLQGHNFCSKNKLEKHKTKKNKTII